MKFEWISRDENWKVVDTNVLEVAKETGVELRGIITNL